MNKVSLLRCDEYIDMEARAAELLSGLGGITAFIRPGQRVLIKPNLLTDRYPDRHVTTHPELVRAIIRLVKQAGGNPVVADSPASANKLEEVWEKTGFRALCADEGVELLNLESAGSERFEVNGFGFNIARPILESDVVINMPKVKTHVLTILTAAVKNMFGTVPGYQKAMLHKLHPRVADFGRLLNEIYTETRPVLNIADGIWGMEGDGPSAGQPVKMGFLAASADGVALDFVLCQLLGIAPRDVPYLSIHCPDGVVPHVPTVGARVEDLRGHYRIPGTLRSHLIPAWLVALLRPFLWIRPSFTDACVCCGRCVKACPMHALSLRPKHKPDLNPPSCIGCCCCHEICPHSAIEMKQSPFLDFIRRGKMP